MPSQTQRGISLIVLPLLSERAGERLFFLTPSSSNTTGYPAYYSPSSFGEAQRRGYDGGCFRLWWESFRILEILLQIAQHYCSQINSLSSKTAFVTIKESIGYKEACKRCPFALQNMPFYTSKDALLQCKRASFRTQKGVDWKTRGKEFDKKGAELRKEKRPPQAPPEEGMWEETGGEEGWPRLFGRRGCAWRDTEYWELGI